jgi:nucleotidyltransferase/DNA polymerase involved in DNA repair
MESTDERAVAHIDMDCFFAYDSLFSSLLSLLVFLRCAPIVRFSEHPACPSILLILPLFPSQVERVRLGIEDRSIPIAVQQWNGLIAVNYAGTDLFATT